MVRGQPLPAAARGPGPAGRHPRVAGGDRNLLPVCLVGVFALGEVRDRFGERIARYFAGWRDALTDALARAGRPPGEARDLAEEAVAAIQGALVAARAFDEPAMFGRSLRRIEARLLG